MAKSNQAKAKPKKLYLVVPSASGKYTNKEKERFTVTELVGDKVEVFSKLAKKHEANSLSDLLKTLQLKLYKEKK